MLSVCGQLSLGDVANRCKKPDQIVPTRNCSLIHFSSTSNVSSITKGNHDTDGRLWLQGSPHYHVNESYQAISDLMLIIIYYVAIQQQSFSKSTLLRGSTGDIHSCESLRSRLLLAPLAFTTPYVGSLCLSLTFCQVTAFSSSEGQPVVKR